MARSEGEAADLFSAVTHTKCILKLPSHPPFFLAPSQLLLLFCRLQVETFLFRPGLTDRAQYYAVTFLNQLVLSHKEREGGSELAKKMIDIYFSLFKLIMAGKMGRAATLAAAQQEQQQVRGQKEGVAGWVGRAATMAAAGTWWGRRGFGGWGLEEEGGVGVKRWGRGRNGIREGWKRVEGVEGQVLFHSGAGLRGGEDKVRLSAERGGGGGIEEGKGWRGRTVRGIGIEERSEKMGWEGWY